MRFEERTKKPPYPHQTAAFEALKKGESVILRAPTGSGKTEAAFIPFVELRGNSLPKRMIYSLPMRALVNSLSSRLRCYSPGIDVKVQHGKRVESQFFDADCVVATLDQVITSYACAPLSLGARYGNIPAGAVAGSFLVFDEVHTYEPRLGLQSSIILAERMKKLGIPFMFMTATLPSKFMASLAERLNCKIIEVDEESIPVRSKRNVILIPKLETRLSPESVLTFYQRHPGRLIVICNTVLRAIELYLGLKEKIEPKPILIHSRFFDEDRARLEERIENLFGKNSGQEAILITTQVIEVGMDISSDFILSELAPVDSLIQRAGRCCRWGGKGKFIVFDIPSEAPYEKELINLTRTTLHKFSGQRLTWKVEKTMVDEVLENAFEEMADPQASGKAMMYLSEGAFKGVSSIAERAVREGLLVEVSIHDNPRSLGEKVFFLPKCRIHLHTLHQFLRERGHKYVSPLSLWRIEMDRDDYHPKIKAIPIGSEEVQPKGFYVIHSSNAAYSPDQGLQLGIQGNPLKPYEIEQRKTDRKPEEIKEETWQDHSLNILRIFENKILPEEDFVYSRLADWLEMDKEKIIELIKFILVLHDLGKLNCNWQNKVGYKGKFLAHSGNIGKLKLPPHATVSAYVLGDYLRKKWGNILGDAAFFAIAHHHSVRAAKVPSYKLCQGWWEEVNEVLSKSTNTKLNRPEVANFESQSEPTNLSKSFPAFENEKTYTTYLVFSRTLRLADREATKSLRVNLDFIDS
ncbi:MAG: CRISPR-associated helicase Cas3' [Candidatus Aminicenantales bacterium]